MELKRHKNKHKKAQDDLSKEQGKNAGLGERITVLKSQLKELNQRLVIKEKGQQQRQNRKQAADLADRNQKKKQVVTKICCRWRTECRSLGPDIGKDIKNWISNKD